MKSNDYQMRMFLKYHSELPVLNDIAAFQLQNYKVQKVLLKEEIQIKNVDHPSTVAANNARLRLLRLTEAAEKLQKQAAISVQKGKENDAREILFQRKKVLQALEKSKTRIELLDELFAKLCEAISMKESQLIGHVSLNIEDKTEESSSPVRIISPKEECGKDITDNDLDFNVMKPLDIQVVRLSVESQGDSLGDKEIEDLQQSLNTSCLNEHKKAGVLTEMSSYEALMEHIDQKLSEIEVELITALKASNLFLDGDENPNNSRWQQAVELLESIHRIRQGYTSLSAKASNLLLR